MPEKSSLNSRQKWGQEGMSKLKNENLLYKDHIIAKLWNFSFFFAAVKLNMAHCEKKNGNKNLKSRSYLIFCSF